MHPLSCLLAVLLLASPALAAEPAAPETPPHAEAAARPALPAAVTTPQSVALPGRTLSFAATAESFRLTDDKGTPQADVAVLAYTLDGADPATRPVAFVFNGGPGASSAWLQLGALGPWRLDMTRPPAPSNPATPIANPDTWLDFADLVFIDPPGTGYSRLASSDPDLRKKFYAVDGDIAALAEVVRRWTVAHGRAAAPHLLVGESYGGFRVPRVARALQTSEGIGVSGLLMISPVLDFGDGAFGPDPMREVARLPSMAAIAADAAGRDPDLAEVETYAQGKFLTDLLLGPRDQAAVGRLVARLAKLTGLPTDLLRRHAGRIELSTFIRERTPGEMASLYDATIAAPDAAPYATWSHQPDAVLGALQAPLTSAMMTLYRRFNWQPEGRYEVLSDAVWHAWDWGHKLSMPESLSALGDALALDPHLKATILHGRDDLVTPYFGTKLELAQLPPLGTPEGSPGRVRLEVLPGGHMLYLRDPSRAAMHAAGKALLAP